MFVLIAMFWIHLVLNGTLQMTLKQYIQQLFIECLLYDLLDSKVILENKTNPHFYKTFILVKKYRL